MSKPENIYSDWNPWHGCTKISPGCKYCYVYRQDKMYGSEIESSECRKTGAYFIKDRKMYRIKRRYQLSQAKKANIDYRIGEYFISETIAYRKMKSENEALTLLDFVQNKSIQESDGADNERK